MCLLLAFSRGALLAVAIGLALWLAVVPLRLRALVALGGVLVADAPARRVGVRAGRAGGATAPRSRCASTPARASARCCCCCSSALTVAGLAVGFLSAVTPPGDRAPGARASRALIGALAAVPGGRDPAARQRARRHRRAGLQGLEAGHRPGRLRARPTRPTRLTDDLVGARPLLARGDEGPRAGPVARHRRRLLRHACGCATASTAAPSGTRTATSCRRSPTSAGSASRCRCSPRARGSPTRRAYGRRAPHATAVCPGTPSASGWRRWRVVALVFGVHSAIDWTWFVPGNACRRCCARAGSPRARRCASGSTAASRRRRVPPRPALRLARRRRVVIARRGLVGGLERRCSRCAPVHAQAAALERARPAARSTAAASIARIAHDRNPLSVDPLFDLAAIEQAAGDARSPPGARSSRRSTSSPRTRRPGAGSGASGSTSSTTPTARCARSRPPTSSTRARAQSITDVVVASRARRGAPAASARGARHQHRRRPADARRGEAR